ncbi:MAG: hypothetical protein WCF24_12485 [Acidimicrobiales bacterium]
MSADEMPTRDETDAAVEAQHDDAPVKAPWHFKVLLVGTAGYLVYRLIWFIFWLTGHSWHG